MKYGTRGEYHKNGTRQKSSISTRKETKLNAEIIEGYSF
jgi:hypothetical protein